MRIAQLSGVPHGAQHHTIWNLSDRGLPRSYRMMNGFGEHTFRMQNSAGETSQAIGATGDGESALGSARIDPGAAGTVVAGPDEVVTGIIGLLGSHRVWERLAGNEATVSA